MNTEIQLDDQDWIEIKDAPAVPGLSFRHFRGPGDYPHMAAVVTASSEVDQTERVTSVEELARDYASLTNCDPYQDMIFAEINGEVVGYARGFWLNDETGTTLYLSVGFLMPAWRRRGIGLVMLRWIENRLRTISQGHPAERQKVFQVYVHQHQVGLAAMLDREGYQPVRYIWEMVRPTLDDIPDYPLPEGFEVRPVVPEHYRAIWDAMLEASRDEWGYIEPTEEDYQKWQENKTYFQPHLWQIAWDTATNQVAGQVLTFIHHAQNEQYNRKRGYTESISVGEPWRKRGLARALIARSLQVQKQEGMTESALGVDSQNPYGASRVYQDCGFRTVKQGAYYRKPV